MSLSEINNILLAGISAIEENQKDNLVEQITKNLLAFDKTELSKINSLLLNLINNGFVNHFIKVIPTEKFYEFGEILVHHGNSDVNFQIIHNYLDIFRRSEFLTRIYNERKWDKLIEELIRKSNLRVKELFEQRAKFYQTKPLLVNIEGEKILEEDWIKVQKDVEKFSKSLKVLLNNYSEETKVAFLLENSKEMIKLDLACLTSGIVNMMIASNSVPEHIELILNQAEAKVIFIADEKQLSKIKSVMNNLKFLDKIVILNGTSIDENIVNFEDFVDLSKNYNQIQSFYDSKIYNVDEIATIMYTSGTTGEPKGILFSYMNIVYKRFCRAMAIPGIEDSDRFLAFLPLFHTFGRYLEMMGTIFWGAEYVFMENPSVEAMIKNMNLIKPTVFISIPKKWIQLYEEITARVNIELDDEEEINAAVVAVTGGKLRFGLSAAGYLPPDIFMFFQRYNIELMSGFGMTEATGGITMTPIRLYKENSLGKALPGIELKLGNDGELLIKGAYVTLGYYKRDDSFDEDGWLHTGDVMVKDEKEFFEIIDRKKEIYKNVKGETIAPQKIENLFRDFEFIKQVFLAGDHRLFNTVLIYPNWESDFFKTHSFNKDELNEIFSSVIVTVNTFLAPFERIIDFRIIERGFDEANGELTPKGTYKRRVVETNFDSLISEMYQSQYTKIDFGNYSIRIPNWFLREKGKLCGDIELIGNKLRIKGQVEELIIERFGDSEFLIGDFLYKIENNKIEFQHFFTNPIYWLGNQNLLEFCGINIFQWYRNREPEKYINFISSRKHISTSLELKEIVRKLHIGGEISLFGLNNAVLLLQSDSEENAFVALDYIKFLSKDETSSLFKIIKDILKRPLFTSKIEVRRKLLRNAIYVYHTSKLDCLLELFFKYNYDILNEEVINTLIEVKSNEILPIIEGLINNTISDFENVKIELTPLPTLFKFLINYVDLHPTGYRTIRRILVQYKIKGKNSEIINLATETLQAIKLGFRKWLGQNQTIAIDIETGEEYTWNDILIFEENIPETDKERLIFAFVSKPIVREAIFFFFNGTIVRLNDILPGGVWISFYKDFQSHRVYRVSIQTRYFGSFDFSIVLNISLPKEVIVRETDWLIITSSNASGQILTDNYGGYCDTCEIWTSEYNPNEDTWHFIERIFRKSDNKDFQMVYHLWPFFIWNATTAILNFAKLTDWKLRLGNTSPTNVVIPKHDYQTGTRIISIESRKEFISISELFADFYINFIAKTLEKFPRLERKSTWNHIFSGAISSMGEVEGKVLLLKLKDEIEQDSNFPNKELALEKLVEFINTLEKGSFIPKRLYFAIKRFRRWKDLNPEASIEATEEMLNELYSNYRLNDVEDEFKETRTKFYYETCFPDSSENLKKELLKLIQLQHQQHIKRRETLAIITEIKSNFELNEKEKYFLTRISYSHLKPQDEAEILKIASSSGTKDNLVVQFFDYDGSAFSIRAPINPKEISRLHKIYLDSSLMVSFRSEHQFLVAISERGYIIGGLFYKQIDNSMVYMDKIVVSENFRRKGISDILMKEFFNRLKNEKYEYVTTGFFRPEYFYKFGFSVEKKYSGLVKKL